MPLASAAFHDVRLGKELGRDFRGGLEVLECEGEAFADAVVGGGEDVRASETEHQKHLDGPFADAADLGQVVDDGGVVHAADAGQRRDRAVEGFGGEVTERESLVGGETGGAQLDRGCVEDLLRRGVERGESWQRLKACDEARMDGGGGFAVKLLIDDGFGEGFKGGLLGGKAQSKGASAFDEAGEFRVGGREMGERGDWIVGQFARPMRGMGHTSDDRCPFIELGLIRTEFTRGRCIVDDGVFGISRRI
jgi:hypothetical protein